MKEPIGRYIHSLRIENGYTLTQLGALLGIDSGGLSKIENSKKNLDPKCLPKLAEVFSLDYEMLKEEYFSEMIAFEILRNSCSQNVLQLAEEKIEYLRNKYSHQSKLDI